jgi:hypothetical protein
MYIRKLCRTLTLIFRYLSIGDGDGAAFVLSSEPEAAAGFLASGFRFPYPAVGVGPHDDSWWTSGCRLSPSKASSRRLRSGDVLELSPLDLTFLAAPAWP